MRKAVLPKLQTPAVRLALHTPFLRERVKAEVCHKLQAAFGGNFIEIVVGGAAFSQDIEAVLHDINFNYTVGYGTTECAPLISYAHWDTFKRGSCGRTVERMEVRVDSSDSEEIEDKLASLPYVTECVVIQKGDKLYGLVYTDPEDMKAGGLSGTMLEAQMEENRQALNHIVPPYARLQAIKLMPEEFEKTPKRSIKRYKYLNYPI